MRIFVKAKPSARKEKIEKVDETHMAIWVKEPPREGKANDAVARALAKYFGIAASRVRLVSGSSGKQKVFEVF